MQILQSDLAAPLEGEVEQIPNSAAQEHRQSHR
jgi:hypothetical protein